MHESLYPLEIVLQGTPISLQSKHGKRREIWKETVRQAARDRQREVYPLGFLDNRALAITIFYFPAAPMIGDIDNIVKPILDAMCSVAYLDDQAVERLTVQKFEPDNASSFLGPTAELTRALDKERPVIYIRVDDDLAWRTVP